MRFSRELGVEIDRVVLFGSRARGDYREDSDYDVLIVTCRGLDKKLRRLLQIKVFRRLADLGIYADVLVIDKEALEKVKDDVGYIYYYAVREGLVL